MKKIFALLTLLMSLTYAVGLNINTINQTQTAQVFDVAGAITAMPPASASSVYTLPSTKEGYIPQINSFLAVGVVSLPGMMTGQILSGIDPLIAVRYQIVVMAMILSSGAMSNILYLRYVVSRDQK